MRQWIARRMTPEVMRKAVEVMIVLWVILLIAFAIAFTKIINLADENRQRIFDIQDSRVYSCQQIYQSIYDVFVPFFPPKAHRTPDQAADIRDFTNDINHRKMRCIVQVNTPKKVKP